MKLSRSFKIMMGLIVALVVAYMTLPTLVCHKRYSYDLSASGIRACIEIAQDILK